MKKNNRITKFSDDVTKWYSDIVLQSELISYAPVKGTMFFKPYGFRLWKKITEHFDKEFEKKDVEEVKFPLLFPLSLLKKESQHIEGFAPEVLTVTKVGEKELNEHYAIRPTSEVLFGTYFKENLVSYNQLPMKLNQWVNVMRWENNTRPFLRNSEFYWQEGHTIHETENEAYDFMLEMIDVYEDVLKNTLMIPVLKGEKTESERFAGAINTFTVESILKDGQALQTGTSHNLGKKFGEAFGVKLQGRDNKTFIPFQTSWGVSTRMIGSLIMTHSDDNGLVLPSKIAPYQIAILTIGADKDSKVLNVAKEIKEKLSSFDVKIDDTNKGIGFKSMNWEIKGVPIRIEIGPKDLEEESIILKVRNNNEKIRVKISELTDKYISNLLHNYDLELYKKAKDNRDLKIEVANEMNDISRIIKNEKVAFCYWEDDKELEEKIKLETGATIRLTNITKESNKAINSNNKVNKVAYFARSY